MKASPGNLTALLELQTRDARITLLAQKLKELQSEPELVTALKRRQAAVHKAKELEARRADLEQAAGEAERRVDDLLARLEKDRGRRDAGGSAKEVSALQRQIESLTTQVEKARTAKSVADQQLDSFMAERSQLLPKLKAADAEAKGLVAQAQERGAAMQAEHQQLTGDREAFVQAVANPALVRQYEKIRIGGHSIRTAATTRSGATCGSCGSTMSPVELREIEADLTEVATCPSCGAIFAG